MEGHGGKHTFDPSDWAKLESPERRARMNPALLARAMGLTGGETVVELGVGTGFFAEAVAPLCARFTGVDLSEKMLEVFRSKPAFAALANIELRAGKAEAAPVEDGVADVVYHVNLFHEIKDTGAFHREITRILRPGGRLYLADWRAQETRGGPPVDHRVPEVKAQALMRGAGFTEVQSLDLYHDHYVIEGRRP